jgi:hypothetical protein
MKNAWVRAAEEAVRDLNSPIERIDQVFSVSVSMDVIASSFLRMAEARGIIKSTPPEHSQAKAKSKKRVEEAADPLSLEDVLRAFPMESFPELNSDVLAALTNFCEEISRITYSEAEPRGKKLGKADANELNRLRAIIHAAVRATLEKMK